MQTAKAFQIKYSFKTTWTESTLVIKLIFVSDAEMFSVVDLPKLLALLSWGLLAKLNLNFGRMRSKS